MSISSFLLEAMVWIGDNCYTEPTINTWAEISLCSAIRVGLEVIRRPRIYLIAGGYTKADVFSRGGGITRPSVQARPRRDQLSAQVPPKGAVSVC